MDGHEGLSEPKVNMSKNIQKVWKVNERNTEHNTRNMKHDEEEYNCSIKCQIARPSSAIGLKLEWNE